MTFRPGDRVRVRDDALSLLRGKAGVVVAVLPPVMVRLDDDPRPLRFEPRALQHERNP